MAGSCGVGTGQGFSRAERASREQLVTLPLPASTGSTCMFSHSHWPFTKRSVHIHSCHFAKRTLRSKLGQ